MLNYYREKNSWCVRIYTGVDSDGKKKFKKLKAQTKEELEAKILKFKKDVEAGVDVYKVNDSLAKWIGRYISSLEDEVDCGNYQENEYKIIKARLQYFLDYKNGLLAKAHLGDILSSHIQPAVNALFKCNPATQKPTAKRTLERYIRNLANVFEFARKQRAYNFCNPCDDVKVPKNAETSEREALNETMISLVMTVEHRARVPSLIMLMAGLRRGEMTALTWNDIDLKSRTIKVNKSFDFKSNKVKCTKTKAGNRIIPINGYLAEILSEEKKKAKGLLVVEKLRGGVMTDQAWKFLYKSYLPALKEAYDNLERADYPFEPFTIHQLRHSFCSMLQWSGVDIKTAQELMGHSEYEVTANIYTHVNDDKKKKAADLQTEYIRNHLIS